VQLIKLETKIAAPPERRFLLFPNVEIGLRS
jgi:hypothetical protein